MTTYIDQAVTEVIPEPEPSTGRQAGDDRWHTRERIRRTLDRQKYQQRRLRAEGFDD